MVIHPNCIYQKIIFSIILQKTKLGYCKLKQRIIRGKLLSAMNDLDTFMTNLKNQIIEDWLIEINKIEDHFICSLLGLAPKSNSK